MEPQLVCPNCRREHDQPGDACLGHVVICLECAVMLDPLAVEIEAAPLAASIAA